MYYGYRAWGPNWPFSSSWTKGSSAGFISDVDAQGNRFNPNKLLNHAIAYQFNGSMLDDRSSSIYVAYNGWSGNVNFMLPSPSKATNWYRVTDTCGWAEGPKQVHAPGAEEFIGGQGYGYDLCGRGLLLLIAK